MKSLIACMTLVGVLVSSPVLAKRSHGYHDTFYDYGRVVRVKPVYYDKHHHSHDRNCYRKEKRYHGHYQHSHKSGNTVVSTVTGAVVGGVIGNAIGSNSKNRKYTTAAGAVIGGAIGHEIGKSSQQYHHSHNNHGIQCSVSSEYGNHHRKIKGYKVTYRYKGETLKTFTRHHPGNRIRVQVQVTPAVYN